MLICFPSSSANRTDGAVACVSNLRVSLTGVSSGLVAARGESTLEWSR